MQKQRSSPRFRFLFLLFFLLVSPHLQGCKPLVFLGGTVVSYALEKVMDKAVNTFWGSASAPKPSDGAFQINKTTGRFLIHKQVFLDKRTGVPIVIESLTGSMKDGKFQYDAYSLNVIKTAMGESFCPNNEKNCKVTQVSQQ